MAVGESWFSMITCQWLRQRLVDGLVGPLFLVVVHAAEALVDARVVCLLQGAWVSGARRWVGKAWDQGWGPDGWKP